MDRETGVSFIYITAKDKEEARNIGKELVNSRLAACVNIIDGVNSIYRWKGRMEDSEETVIIAKTKSGLIDKLIKKVKSIHSYTCPCIVSLPVSDGNPDFLKWIAAETE